MGIRVGNLGLKWLRIEPPELSMKYNLSGVASPVSHMVVRGKGVCTSESN